MKYTHKRLCATLLALLQVTVAPLALATDLTDVPMAVKNVVVPNIMFTLDDSGSMQWEALPDGMVYVYYMFPRAPSVYSGTDYTNYTVDSDPANRYARLLRSSNNKVYYDPAKRYKPWSNSDGSLMANASPTAAPHNPTNTGAGTRDLTASTTTQGCWLMDGGWFTACNTNRTYFPATYFRYAGGNVWTAGNYTQVVIDPTTTSYTGSAARTDCAAAPTCTYAEEIQNFANWYTYYRSRVLTARAGSGRAFASQGNGMRVGFGAINKGTTNVDGLNTDTIIVGVRKFDGTDRTNFFTQLYGHPIPAAGTPLRKAMDDVGQYFRRGGGVSGAASPWAEIPGTTSGTHYACRANYHILMTDGYWNGASASTAGARLNVDGTSGVSHNFNDTYVTPNVNRTFTYTAAAPFTDTYADTLADIAMYYWLTDLRTDLDDRVPVNSKDPAFWQHMVNFTVGLGVSTNVSSADIQSALSGGTPAINWPDASWNQVDDLAHAAVNSRGGFFSASDPDQFATALSDALDDIVARTGAAAAVAVANANVTSGDSSSYASSYNSGTWTGDLDAFDLDLITGIPNPTSLWNPSNNGQTAQGRLDARTAAATDRYIATYSGTGYSNAGVQFQPNSATIGGAISSKLSVAQSNRFNTPSTTDNAAVISYLRGDRSGETAGTYRTRAHLLGDIINAEPLVIRAPSRYFIDPGYSAFKTYHTVTTPRTKMVFQGANDGLLHGFVAATGAENWAYVPNRLIEMTDPNNSGTSTLNMLSRKTYSHRMYIDATPVSGDIDFDRTDGLNTGTSDWRTILVGGLGKGGRGVYALDVTTPNASSEANAASKVLWEFPNATTNATDAANVGYVFGRPSIVRTVAKGWVVLVPAGFNNGTGTDNSGGDGHGYLFVLNARTGALIKAIDTTVGSTADPSGLAHISALVKDANYNPEVKQVYGGDLKGNVWRFDLTDSNINNWGVKRLAILKDSSGATQPITTEPQFADIKMSGAFKRLVYVGTGRYLGDTDVPDSQTQTMYGLVDDLSSTVTGINPVIADPARNSLQQQTLTQSGATRTVTNNAVNYTNTAATIQKGWYVDLPDPSTAPSERVNTHPVLVSGALVFTSNIPSADPCIPGGSSWLNVLDYKTGGILTGTTVAWASYSLGNVLASRPILIKVGQGIKALVRTSDGQTITSGLGFPAASTVGRRIGWREIPK